MEISGHDAASDPLLGIVRKYHEVDAASDRAFKALDEAEGNARKRCNGLPTWGLIRVEAEGRQFDWTKDEIEKAATAEGCYGVQLTTKQRDKYLPQLDELRRKGLDRYKELGLDTLYLENERCREAFWESLERVFATPAACVEGFAAKVLVFCDHAEHSEPSQAIIQSVKADADRLAGEA